MSKFSQPTLPALYFCEHETATSASSSSSLSNNQQDRLPELPAEILYQCLATYADWGDLAKLASVQKSWSNIVSDAASQSPESKWDLAQAMLDGECGLERNPTRAMKLMLELANVETDEQQRPTSEKRGSKCFAPAMKRIADCFFTGNGVDQDAETGMSWLHATHDHADDADAAHDLALAYEYGRYGIDIDVVAAAEWFEKAATKGHIEAMAELALCYELGCGVEQSDEKALDWYTKAANKGHVTSKFSVAEIYEQARGVPQSDEEACLWYYRAAVLGDEDSKEALRRLYDIARIVVPGIAALLEL